MITNRTILLCFILWSVKNVIFEGPRKDFSSVFFDLALNGAFKGKLIGYVRIRFRTTGVFHHIPHGVSAGYFPIRVRIVVRHAQLSVRVSQV